MAEKPIETSATTDVVERERTRSGRHYRPHVDILEHADELTVLADMPGVKADAIDIHFENGALTIYGKVDERQAAETEYLMQEYGVGDFSRTFQVSEHVDAARITAEYADGVLTLHLPKVEAAKPRKITVQTT